MSGCDQGKRGGKPGGAGWGHLHNIPFIHRTKQTSRVTIAVRSWQHGKREEQVGNWGVVKKNTGPPTNRGSWGGTWSVSTQEESEDQKRFGKARTVRDGGRRWRKVQGVRRLFGNWGEGTALPLLGSPQPLLSGRKGVACSSHGQVWGCQMLQAGGWRGLTKACPPGR